MKFNMFNWILETFSTFLVFISLNRYFTLLYIVTISCGTPIVYFMGIEENRNLAKDYFKSNIRIFKKKSIEPKHKKKTVITNTSIVISSETY